MKIDKAIYILLMFFVHANIALSEVDAFDNMEAACSRNGAFEITKIGDAGINVFEAIKIAEVVLSSGKYDDYMELYLSKKLEIAYARKYFKQSNVLLYDHPCRRIKDDEITRYDRVAYRIIKIRSYDDAKLCDSLIKKGYWLIYFVPADGLSGGDIGFFIDSETSEIIHVYRSQ